MYPGKDCSKIARIDCPANQLDLETPMSVLVKRLQNVAVITIDRPAHRNAVDAVTARLLADAFRNFDADGTLDVAILTGANGHFCAGADLKAYAAGERKKMAVDGDGPMGPSRMKLSKPVIAAVEGYAVAGGSELALWCDLRVISQTAVFGIFCRRFGVPLIDRTVRLPRLIGHSRAMDLILTGREVRAQEALDIGLANRLVEEGQALSAAVELAQQIAAFPQTCMRNDRLSAIEQWGMDEAAALRNEFTRGQQTLQSGEAVSGASAFAAGAGRHGSVRD
jgi:enoyl-CoA hydratase